ncbi:MAG: cation transporter [Stackebrandtia sp.]
MGQPVETDSTRRRRLLLYARCLVGVTVAYNVIEAVAALAAGITANSMALIGFGLDSAVEVLAAAVVLWQVAAREDAERNRREHVALRMIAMAFFTLAAFVAAESLRGLRDAAEPRPSVPGLVLAVLGLFVMPALAAVQRRAGRQLGSTAAVADARQTLLSTYLSAILLIGLGLNAFLGWGWADSLAALVIAGVAVREGIQAWRGDLCCAAPKPGSRS